MNYDAQHHLAAIVRARALQHYGTWAPNVPHTYGLPPPDAPIAPLANVGPQPFHVNHGAVSEAPGQQIAAAHPHARLSAATPTGPAATAPMGHNVGGGAVAIHQQVALAPAIPETNPMKKIALIPPTDITPEAAVVSYPKPIHTQTYPLVRYPQGALQPRCHVYISVLKYFNSNTVPYCTEMDFFPMRQCKGMPAGGLLITNQD